MDYKFKLSDIVKYILLGAIFIALVAFSLLSYSGFRLIEINNQYIKIASDFSFLLTAIAISLSYLIGLMIHSFNELVISSYGKLRNRRTYFSTRNHDFSKGFKFNIQIFEFNIREIYSKVFSKVFAKALAYILELLFYKNTINYTCNSLNKYGKKTGVYDEDIPKWIVLSYNPDKMLLVLSEKIASRDGGDSKSEFLYLNEFVLGLRSTLIALISIISYRILADNSKYDELAIFIPIGILLWCFLSFFAKSFAIKYIKHIDTCIEAGGIDINELLHKKELPCAYILIRTTTSRDHLFFKKMVKSVVTQDYQNIKVIIQEDIDIKNSNKESRNTLQEFIDIKNSLTTDKNEYIKIVYCADKYGGAAGSSIAIREKFCDLASDTDIAIFLDDDDEFVSRNSVSSIMLKMVATDADLCMVAFGVTDALGHNIISNGSKNDYNNLLNKISFHNRTVKYESVDNMYHAASMGWTKCYKRSVLETYCQIVRRCDEIRKESNRSEFADLKSYEDFPDYMCLLFRNLKLIAINESIYNYNQHQSSITSNLTLDCFRIKRIGFLHYLGECVALPEFEDTFIDDVKDEALCFIKYKLHIISGIIEKRKKSEEAMSYSGSRIFEDYSIDNFFEDYNTNMPDGVERQTTETVKVYSCPTKK